MINNERLTTSSSLIQSQDQCVDSSETQSMTAPFGFLIDRQDLQLLLLPKQQLSLEE